MSNDVDDPEYELGSVRHQERERYEPFASELHTPYSSPAPAGDHGYIYYQGHVPETQSRAPSITQPIPKAKTAVASVQSLASQHDYASRSPESAHARRALRTTFMSRAFEIFAVIISLGALLAIIFVLRREDGRPLTAWTLAVTLNTVIAALGTLARSTLAFALSACVGQQKWNWLHIREDQLVAWERFDEASRGPWGATRLFIWLRAR